MENTVENTQDDNNAIKSMRERIKELEGVERKNTRLYRWVMPSKMQVLTLTLDKVKH